MSTNDTYYYEGILARHEEKVGGNEISKLDNKTRALERRLEIEQRVIATLLAKEKRREAKMLVKVLKAAEPFIRKKEKMRDLKGSLHIISGLKAQRNATMVPETIPEDCLYMTIATMIGYGSRLKGKQKAKNQSSIDGLIEVSKKRGLASTIEEILFLVSCIPLERRDEFTKSTGNLLRGIGLLK